MCPQLLSVWLNSECIVDVPDVAAACGQCLRFKIFLSSGHVGLTRIACRHVIFGWRAIKPLVCEFEARLSQSMAFLKVQSRLD